MCERFTKFLKTEGYLFVVLPLPCISNSRYMNAEIFKSLMSTLGYNQLKYHEANKVCYFLFQRQNDEGKANKKQFYKKLKVRDGPKMNNFSIILPQ